MISRACGNPDKRRMEVGRDDKSIKHKNIVTSVSFALNLSNNNSYACTNSVSQ